MEILAESDQFSHYLKELGLWFRIFKIKFVALLHFLLIDILELVILLGGLLKLIFIFLDDTVGAFVRIWWF